MLTGTNYYPHFFTATILEWKPLLKQEKYKHIIVESLKFLYQNKRAVIYGFVIMPNHIHLLWRIAENYKRKEVQRDFLKYTAPEHSSRQPEFCETLSYVSFFVAVHYLPAFKRS